MHASAKKFGISVYDYLYECGFEYPASDSYYSNYLVVLPQKIDDLNSMFDFLVSVLPENIEETRRKKALQEEALQKAKQHQQEELRKQEEQRLENLRKARQQQLKEKRKCKAETSVQKVLSICGENFSKAGSPCILLFNPGFIDEKQEYDHLIVSCKGVFNIETKNLAGKFVIDKAGNWIRKKDGDEEGVKNPLQQVRQHEKLLASFLPKECRIISILCIANDKAIIEGSEHCPVPIVKSDLLVEFIENWQTTDSELSDEQKKDCITAIYERMV